MPGNWCEKLKRINKQDFFANAQKEKLETNGLLHCWIECSKLFTTLLQ